MMGQDFLDCCQKYGLVLGDKIFPHKPGHKYTWISLDGLTVSHIDHITISGKSRANLLDVRALHHHLVRSKVKVKLSKLSSLQPIRRFDTKNREKTID